METRRPNQVFHPVLDQAPTGLVGTIRLRLEDVTGGTIIAASTSGIIEAPAGSGIYIGTMTAPSLQGDYVIVWDNGTTTYAAETLRVTYDSAATSTGPNLTTLQDLKDLLGIADSSEDSKLNAAIADAAVAIRTHTGRSFGFSNVNETRTFAYDKSGWLEIDDASAITAITLDGISLVNSYDYVLGPDRGLPTPDVGPIYEWIELRPGLGQSPQMGFERNLDTLYIYGTTKRYSVIAVTGTFGWPTVPGDVRRAALWTAAEFASSPAPYSSQAISSYSYTQGAALHVAIPDRAKELLFPYKRLS